MKDIIVHISDIKITSQPNGDHYLILITISDAYASMAYSALMGRIQVHYAMDLPNDIITFKFILLDSDETFSLNIDLNAITREWIGWLDNKKVTELHVAYPNQNKEIVRYGQVIHPVFQVL